MSKAKVIVKVGDDFFTIAQNVWKMFKGSKDVVRSSATVAKREGRIIKNASQSTIKNKAQTNKLRRANEADVARGGLKRAGESTKKIDLKSRYLKNGKPKPKTKTTNDKRVNPWSKTNTTSTVKPKTTQAQRLRDADVVKSKKINLKNAKVGSNVWKGTKKAGVVVMSGGKKFIRTKTGALIAIGSATAGLHYLGKAIDKKIAGTNGAATTSSGAATTTKPKPPKPSGPVTTAPAPPSVLSAQEQAANQTKPPKPQQSGPSGGPPQRQPTKTEPKTFEQKLKDKWVEFRGGDWKGSDAAWKTHVLDMRRGSEVGLTYKDTQDYGKIIKERKELAAASKGATKKKRGGVIKRNKGGPVRGVGKALRGYGNNSIYSNKMY